MSLDRGYWRLGRYSSDQVDILQELVRPMLKQASKYDRSVAYLKSSHLNDIALELFEFAEKGGFARYLIGDPLEYEQLRGIQAALARSEDIEYLEHLQLKLVEYLKSARYERDEDLPNIVLQYLVAKGDVEIRLILRAGLHHEKIRIASDENGDVLTCIGSDNDSRSALTGANKETGVLVASWAYPGTDYWETHGLPAIQDFEKEWNNENDKSFTFKLTDGVLGQISEDWESRKLTKDDLFKRLKEAECRQRKDHRELRPYQFEAMHAWEDNDYRGIMALCTGAGKTFTSINAARLVADYWNNEGNSFAIVVAVPYKILAYQWVKELSVFFPQVIPCWSDFKGWREQLEARFFHCFGVGNKASTLVAVVVNDTLVGQPFQRLLHQIPTDFLMWIGDEVHQHASERFYSAIPKDAGYILGLSATPWSRGQQEKAKFLTNIYGDIVAEFGIADALREKVLVPYFYDVSIVELTEEETEEYGRVSEKLARFTSRELSSLSADEVKEMGQLVRTRNALIGTCESKVDWLANFARQKKLHHTLIYCAEGSITASGSGEKLKALDYVAEIFSKQGWALSKITASETTEKRDVILSAMMKKDINAILAIRVLDEGFDLPLCRHALLLSSSRNERQFIQRRGRVLRTHPTKEDAIIFDFVVLPHDSFRDESWAKSLTESEAIRAWEFGRYSKNSAEVDALLQSVFSDDLESLERIKQAVESRSYDDELEEMLGGEGV